MPQPVQLPGRRRPDAPEGLDRQRVQERELALGRHLEQPVGLRDAARDLGQELRPRDADRERQPDLLEHAAAQPRGDLERRARPSPHAANVDEGLVDRQRLDERRRVLEHAVHGLARLRVGVHARPDDDRARGRGGAPRAPPMAVRMPNAFAS